MMAKDCIKTIRLSQEDLDFIESQPGSTFSKKFDGLIALMRDEVPAKVKELDRLQRQLQKKRIDLQKYERDVYSLGQLISNSLRIHNSLNEILDGCEKLLSRVEAND